MSGGLLQLASSGIQDVYLTKNPEITFFKKMYRRHTNFSMELISLKHHETADYDNNVSFNIESLGDLLHRVYLEIVLPVLSLTDSIITDLAYVSYKEQQLSNIQLKIDKWNTLYNNLKNFASIEFSIYQKLIDIFKSENLTITIIQAKVQIISNNYEKDRNKYKLLVDEDLLSKIDIIGYILNLDTTSNISTTSINIEIINRYNLCIRYLKYYHSNWIYHKNKYTERNEGKIDYSWTKYVGENYINSYSLSIGGQTIESYSNDQLHLYQKHNIKYDRRENYDKMIGHEETNYNYGHHTRKSNKLMVPLIFWFCKKSINSLPLIALKYSNSQININVNKLNNIINFQDWESEYNKLLIVDIAYEDHSINNNNTVSVVSDLVYSDIEVLDDSYIYRYTCTKMNEKLLDLQFPGIDSNAIVTNYGTLQGDSSYILTMKDYIYMMSNIKTDSLLSTATKQLLAGYHYYVDYNYLQNQVEKPVLKLYGEYVYLDDIEREKFTSSHLEYVVELYNEITYNITNTETFDYQLDLNSLNKELLWFIRPKVLLNGFTPYNKTYHNTFIDYPFYSNSVLNNVELYLNGLDLLKLNSIDNYYQKVIPYNHLNNELENGVYYINLSLFPEKNQPTGSVNMSQIRGKTIKVSLNTNFLSEYFDSGSSKSLNPSSLGLEFKILSRSYNILIITKGQGKLIFYQK
jgi:hypothetical protein